MWKVKLNRVATWLVLARHLFNWIISHSLGRTVKRGHKVNRIITVNQRINGDRRVTVNRRVTGFWTTITINIKWQRFKSWRFIKISNLARLIQAIKKRIIRFQALT